MTNDSKIDDAVAHFLRDCELPDLIAAAGRQPGGLRQLRADLQGIITEKFEQAREILRKAE